MLRELAFYIFGFRRNKLVFRGKASELCHRGIIREVFNLVQFAEMDRRPWQPRQLAGENSSARLAGASSDSGEGFREKPVDAAAGTIAGTGSDTLIDPARSITDVAFKPKCLGIHSSMSEYRSTPIRVSDSSQARISSLIIEASLIYPPR